MCKVHKVAFFSRIRSTYWTLAYLALAFFVGIACIPSLLSTRTGSERFCHLLSQLTGCQIEVERLELAWFGHQEVHQLHLRTAFSEWHIEKITLPHSLIQPLKRLHFYHPKGSLRLIDESSLHPPFLPFESIHVEEGTLQLSTKQDAIRLDAVNLECNLADLYFSIRAEVSDGVLSGRFNGTYQGKEDGIEFLTFDCENLAIQPFLKTFAVQPFGNDLSGYLTIQGSSGEIKAHLKSSTAELIIDQQAATPWIFHSKSLLGDCTIHADRFTLPMAKGSSLSSKLNILWRPDHELLPSLNSLAFPIIASVDYQNNQWTVLGTVDQSHHFHIRSTPTKNIFDHPSHVLVAVDSLFGSIQTEWETATGALCHEAPFELRYQGSTMEGSLLKESTWKRFELAFKSLPLYVQRGEMTDCWQIAACRSTIDWENFSVKADAKALVNETPFAIQANGVNGRSHVVFHFDDFPTDVLRPFYPLGRYNNFLPSRFKGTIDAELLQNFQLLTRWALHGKDFHFNLSTSHEGGFQTLFSPSLKALTLNGDFSAAYLTSQQFNGRFHQSAGSPLHVDFTTEGPYASCHGNLTLRSIDPKPTDFWECLDSSLLIEGSLYPPLYPLIASATWSYYLAMIGGERVNLHLAFNTSIPQKRFEWTLSNPSMLIQHQGTFQGERWIFDHPIQLELRPNEFLMQTLSKATGIQWKEALQPIEARIHLGTTAHTVELNLGKLVCEDLFNYSKLQNFLRRDQLHPNIVWFAPMTCFFQEGVLCIDRLDLLLKPHFEAVVFGKVDFLQKRVDLNLGLLSSTVHHLLGKQFLPEGHLLTLPIQGPFSAISCDFTSLIPQVFLSNLHRERMPEPLLAPSGAWIPWKSVDPLLKSPSYQVRLKEHRPLEAEYSLSLDPLIDYIEEQVTALLAPQEKEPVQE